MEEADIHLKADLFYASPENIGKTGHYGLYSEGADVEETIKAIVTFDGKQYNAVLTLIK